MLSGKQRRASKGLRGSSERVRGGGWGGVRRRTQIARVLFVVLVAGVIALKLRQLPESSSQPTASLEAVPIDNETLVFASVSGLAPKFMDSGPEKGMGWAEVQTQEIRKGLIQDGFKVKQEWMTPARIAHEMRMHHPICVYPVEWNHPERLFAKKQDRLYSIGLTLAEQETRTILFNQQHAGRFSKHLDKKGDLNLESLFKDSTLKTVLIRDKDYGFITQWLTRVDEQGEQVVRDEFKTHVSLLVVKDNRQLIEMLHAERFDYSFSELDQKELNDSKLSPGQFGQIPYDTIRVKDSRDPNLVQVSLACSVHPLTIKALPYINRWVSIHRGIFWEMQNRSYRSLLEGKEISQQLRYGMVISFKGIFEGGGLDGWVPLQARHFPGLRVFPPEPSPQRVAVSPKPAPALRWILAEESPGELTLFNDSSTGMREEFNTNLSPYTPHVLNFQVSRVERTLSPSQKHLLNDSSPFLERKSYASIKEIPREFSSPPKKMTVFASGLKPEDLPALKPYLQSSSLRELAFFGGSGPVIAEVVASLPKSIKRLNFMASSLTLTTLPEALRGLSLQALHLNDTELSEDQLEKVLELLPPSLEELSLGFQRRAWTPRTAQAFAKRKFPRLRTLDLENCFLSDTEFQWIAKGIPSSLEELRLGYNVITHRTLRPLFPQGLPALHTLDLSGNFPFRKFPSQQPLVMPQGIRNFAAQDCNLNQENLSDLILPQGLTSINLSSNALGDDGLALILPKLGKKLHQLRLSNTRITERSTEAIARSGITAIDELHLGTNRLGDAAIEALSRGSIEIKRLFLPANRITTRGANLIAQKWMGALEALSLAGNPISSSGISQLAKKWSSRLVELDLGNLVSLDVAQLAAALPPKLILLDLSQNQLSNADIEVLAKHLPKTLETLVLSGAVFDQRGAKDLAASIPPSLHQLFLDKVPLGGEGFAAVFQSLPPSVRKLVVGPMKLTPEQTSAIGAALPQGLVSLRWVQSQFEPVADPVVRNLPESLRECFFISTPVVLSRPGMDRLRLPSNLRDLSLEGGATDGPTIEALIRVLPSSLEEFLLMGPVELGATALGELAKRDLRNQRTLAFGGHLMTPKSIMPVLKHSGGPRVLAFFGPLWKAPQEFAQFESRDFKNVRAAAFSNFALPSSTLIAVVKRLPAEMFLLGLNSSGMTLSSVPALIRVLPRELRILNISGNDIGQKGHDLFRAYKEKREREDGIPFNLME